MVLKYRFFELRVFLLGGFDKEEQFFGSLLLSLPPIKGFDGRGNINACGELAG
jgi:hypothetical protein